MLLRGGVLLRVVLRVMLRVGGTVVGGRHGHVGEVEGGTGVSGTGAGKEIGGGHGGLLFGDVLWKL